MKSTPLYLTLLFITVSSAQADWKFSGSAGPYVNALNFPSTTVSPSLKTGLSTELKLDNKINNSWRVKSEFFFRNDFLARDSVETLQWNPKNLYIQKKSNSLVFRLGFQTLSIDGPDIINPADVVHSKNFVDPTNPITYSSAGLSVSQEIEKWNWEVFYIPLQTPPVLPGAHSPWLPRKNRLPVESNNLEFRIPDNVRYQYQKPKELDHALKNNVSVKVQRKSENLEAQVVLYDGLSQSPFILAEVDSTLISASPKYTVLANSPVKLRPLYYRQQVAAGTFVIPLSSWAIRGGMNWTKPYKDERVPGETITAVMGLEKNIETSIGMITMIGQYIRQQRQVETQISFLRSFFQEALSFGARVPWGEETSFFLGGIYDQRGYSSIYKLGGTHRITNSWSIEAGAQYLQGPKKTLIGLYDRYDTYLARAIYSW